jgi:hypothetical protein
MCDQPEPSANEQSSVLSEFIKTVVQDVIDGVVPIIKNYQTTIEELAARLEAVESVLIAQKAQIEAMELSIKQVESDNGLVRVEIQKMQYSADIRQSKQAAGNICAFPVKKPPQYAGNPGDSGNFLKTLASEVPGVSCAIKPIKSGIGILWYRFGNRVPNVRFAIGREDSLRIWVSLAEIADRAFVTQVGLVNNHILN